MNALVLHAVGDARLQEVPRPEVGHGDVAVRVGFCGVCGSDIPRVFVKGTYSFPTICGHEFAGVVEEVGPGVDDVSPGDRVAVFPLIWCGQCSACALGVQRNPDQRHTREQDQRPQQYGLKRQPEKKDVRAQQGCDLLAARDRVTLIQY